MPKEQLIAAARAGQTEPVIDYIRNNYADWKQFRILSWIVENIPDDEYIARIYQQIGEMDRNVFRDPSGHFLLFQEPLIKAQAGKREQVQEEIITAGLRLNGPALFDLNPAIAMAAYSGDMITVRAHMRVFGPDFINDPEILYLILYKDNVELMKLCLRLGTDRNLTLNNGQTLLEAAKSDEMRDLLFPPTEPTEV